MEIFFSAGRPVVDIAPRVRILKSHCTAKFTTLINRRADFDELLPQRFLPPPIDLVRT